jgi:enterobacterial common antigen flippase
MTRTDTPAGRAIVSTVTATAVILGCGLITGLIAARTLGPDGRGELAAVTVWATVLLYAGTLGLPEATAYFAAADRGARARIWTTAQIAAAVLGTVVMVAGWWLLEVIPSAPERRDTTRWFLMWFAIPCLGSLCASSWLQGAGFVHRFNVTRSSVHVVNAAGMLIIAALGARTPESFAAILLIGNMAGWLFGLMLGPLREAMVASPSIGLARQLYRYGIRVQLGNWSNAASVRLDQLLLSIFASAANLGLYVVAVTYANVLMVIPGSASLVMLPRMVRHHHDGTGRECLERWYRRVLWTAVLGAAAIGASSLYLLPLLFGASFASAVPLVALLVPATIILGMNVVLSTAFRGIGRPDIASKAEIVGLVTTCAGLAALLPPFGVYGAAIASIVAYASVHGYMTVKARAIFGTTVRALCVPTHDDFVALRGVIIDARLLLARNHADRIRTQEL